MLAVQVERFGVENLKVAEAPDPVPGPGEVLIAMEAATINPADMTVVSGAAASRLPAGATPPYTPGWDLAGRIVGCGHGADRSLEGARVVGFSLWFAKGHGTQASLVALPAGDIAPAPNSLPSTHLTTVGLNGLTAWAGLADLHLSRGETLVITGAAGGVGGFAVELALARGVNVIAAVRAHSADDARELGPQAIAVISDGDLGTVVRQIEPAGADALLDTASIGATALAAVRDGGRYVSVTVLPEPERDISVMRSGARMDTEGLATLVRLASEGHIHTPVAQEFLLEDARHAYEAFATRHGRGRIVLKA
jgi:NADPH:quinone reductase